MGKLTVTAMRAVRHPGTLSRPIRIGDGGGLYLQVAPGGSRSWLFRYTLAGKAREMGLGSVALTSAEEQAGGVPLADAREAARMAKALLRKGVDPIEARRAAERGKAAVVAPHTFREVAEMYADSRKASWVETTLRDWRASMAAHALGRIGNLPVAAVGTAEVLGVLRPLWLSKAVTATRLRLGIEGVLDYAAALNWRTSDNPARWKGHLDKLLSKPPAEDKHFPALPWAEIGAFMAELRAGADLSARALEFLVLTVCRTTEVRAAHWGEVDLSAAVWTVPAGRTKIRREHRVPLSGAAVKLLRTTLPPDGSVPAATAPVFSMPNSRRPLHDRTMLALLERMNPHAPDQPARWRDGRTGEAITVHGFRSTFRDWLAERTDFPRELGEAGLAHKLGKVEAAYQRGDMLDRRRKVMEAWGEFCANPMKAGEVVPLRRVVGQ